MQSSNPSEMLHQIVNKISEVMAIMDAFQDSRPGSIAFTKLEEAIMWLQVMTHNVALKPYVDEKSVENVSAE